MFHRKFSQKDGLKTFRWVSVCAQVFLISLIFESTNLLVNGSIEASSPEEIHANDLPLSGSIPSGRPLVDFDDLSFAGGVSPASPIVTNGVFPYQPNPIGAIVAAGLTMAVMAMKEGVGLDLEGLSYLINSSDFYVGLAGSAVSSATHRQTIKAIESALARGAGNFPDTLKPLLNSPNVRLIGNIINGFTYTFAISTGFEYFSQVWKHATRNIPEAHTVTGFIKADPIRKKQVALNLMYYLVVDTNMQKRILSSVYNHRIMTFEFIATNVGLYVGAQLGALLAAKYGKESPMLQRLGQVIGSISGGLLVQAIPASWASAVNREWTESKLASHEKTLRSDLAQIKAGIENRFYSTEKNSAIGYWLRGASLEADIDRVFRERDMIASLRMQVSLSSASGSDALSAVSEVFDSVENEWKELLKALYSEGLGDLKTQIQKWIQEGQTGPEIQRLGVRYPEFLTRAQYYSLVLSAAIDRCRLSKESVNALNQWVQNKKWSPSEIAIFGF